MTILEIFNEKIKNNGVIKALQLLDEFIADKDIDLDLEEEIVDFGDFFVDNYEDETYDERIEVFGEEDALILRIYDCIVEKENEESSFFEECESILTKIPRKEQQEVEKAYEDLTFLKGTKNIYFQFDDCSFFSCEISENLSKDQELQLKSILAKAINQEAVLLIELIEEKIVTAVLFRNKETRVINKYGIKKIHSLNPHTGEKIKQKGFTYIDMNKLIELTIKKTEVI